MTQPAPRVRLLLAAFALALAACGDVTVSTPDPVPQSLTIQADSVRLELNDSTRLEASVLDETGSTLAGIEPTWSTSDARVATVDASGLVVGVGAGTARVTASAGGASASIDVTVLAWNIADHAVVVDSTSLRLISDSTERAEGTYRFEELGSAPTIVVGNVIVGAQGGGFLRRVTTVGGAGGEIVLGTEAASLSEIIEEGAFEAMVTNLTFDGGAPAPVGPLSPGEIRWGPPRFHPAVEGVALTPQGSISLSGLDICAELKKLGGPICPSGISKLEVKTGTLDFGPDFELEATFSGLSLETFRGTAKGTVTSKLELLLEAKTSTDLISPQLKIAGVTRPFYGQIGPVPVLGYVELALTGGLEVKATAKGSVQAGFSSSHSLEIGGEWKDGSGWTEVFESQNGFDAQEPSVFDGTLSGQIDIEHRLFVKPEIKIIFYGVVGPFLNVEPYGKYTMTFGTTACGMKTEAGINSEIGFTIPFLAPNKGTLSKKNSPWFTWGGKEWTCPLGSLDVSTVTNGQQTDPDGYTIRVDSVSKGSVPPNGQTVFDFIEVGSREVTLEGVASNCSVTGNNPVSVTIATGLITPVDFDVQCALPGGDLTVDVTTTGSHPDPNGYEVTLDQSQTRRVDPNGSVTFANIPQGTHDVFVQDLAPNCAVAGANPTTVQVASATVTLPITVDCPATRIVVATSTSGVPATDDWAVVLDGSQTKATNPNGQVTFDVAPGAHTLRLDGVADNCTIEGENPRSVTVSGSTLTETFKVTCAVGGVLVEVSTTGDPAPATSYSVRVGDVTKTVDVNGLVDFQEVPEGPVTVELLGLPSHCLAQGENPRQINAPGSTSFDVLCEQPLECVAPPDSWGIERWDAPTQSWDSSEPPPTMTWDINPEEIGDIGGLTTITQSTDNQSAHNTVSLGWYDAWSFLPVDQTRAGESVTVLVHIIGQIERTVDPERKTGAAFGVVGGGGRLQGEDPDFLSVNEIVELPAKLGDWVHVAGDLYVQTTIGPGNAGAAASAHAWGRIEKIVGVVDADGQNVPILQTCTASGKQY